MDVQTLADVLALTAASVVLDHATVTIEPARVVLRSPAQVLGRAGFVSLVITPDGEALTVAAAGGLTDVTLADMAALGWLDPSIDVGRAGGLVFPVVEIQAGATAPQVKILAPLPAAAVLSGAPFAMAGASLEIVLSVIGANVAPVSAAVVATMGSDGLPVSVTLPTAFTGWSLQTAPGVVKTFASLGSDLDTFLGTSVSGLLPAGLPGGFGLKDLAVELSSETASPVALKATVQTTEPWRIVPGALELDSAFVTLRARRYPAFIQADSQWSYDGDLGATVSFFDAPVEIRTNLALSTLSLRARPWLTFPGLGTAAGKLTAVLGGSDFSASLPPALATMASITLEEVALEVDPAAQKILSAQFTASKPSDLDWTFPLLPGLTITDARMTMHVASPLDAANRSVSGLVGIVGLIGDAETMFSVVRQAGASTCSLSLTSSTGIALPDLLGLVGLDSAGFSAALPSGLSVVSDFALMRLDGTYDIDGARMTNLDVSMGLSDPWKVIPDHLELTHLDLDISIVRPTADAADQDIGLSFLGEVAIGGAGFVVTASSSAGSAGWIVDAGLADDETLSLTDMGAALLPAGLTLPAGFPDLTLDAAYFQIATDTLAVNASFATALHWAPTVLGKTGDMAQLSLALAVQPQTADGSRPYALTVAGQLVLESFPTLSAVCVTGSGATATEILAVLSPADLQALSLDAVATSFAGTGSDLTSAPRPSGFDPPTFTSAAFYADITNPCLVVFGQASRFGAGAFIVRTLPAPDGAAPSYGVALVLNTGADFKFADILPDAPGSALKSVFSAIDGVIQVEEASLSLSTFDIPAGATNPFSAMGRLSAAAAALPTPIDVPTLPAAIQVKRGLNLDAKLKISTDSFWQGFKYIIEARADADIRLYALFDPQTPGTTRFEASLGGFVILQTLTFDHVDLVYVPNAANAPPPSPPAAPPTSGTEPASPAADPGPVSGTATTAPTLTLTCSGSLSIPTFAANSQSGQQDTADTTLLNFTGDLAVTQTGADALFTLKTDQLLRRPLGIPGITITSVGVAIKYAFGTDAAGTATRTLTRFAAQGVITLGDVVDLKASVLFVSGSPQIVLVELTKPVTLNDIFNQCIGTDAFNALPTLTFNAGHIYYARVAVGAAGTEPAYIQGFHLAAAMTLFDVDFAVALDVVEADGVRGTASTVHALDWGIVTITGQTGGDTGPGLSVAALKTAGDANKELALLFGFKLFGLQFINGKIAYQTAVAGGEPTYTGSIAYSGDTPLGSNPSLSIRWTKSGGFEVTDWPAELPIKNLTTLFNLASADSPCGALTALGLADDFVQGRCSADISLSADTPRHNDDGTTTPVAKIDIGLRYLVSIPNPDTSKPRIVLNAGAPAVPITVRVPAPQDATIASLASTITDAAESAIAGVLKAILDDPAAMVTFVGTIAAVQGLQHLANDAINSLICRDIDSEPLKNEYRSRHPDDAPDDNPGDDGDEADRALKKAKDLADAARKAKKIADAIEAASQILATAAVISGFFASIIAAVVHLFGGKTSEEKRRDRMLDEVQAQKDAADAAIKARLAITGLAARYDGNGALHVSWNGVDEDGVRYHPTLTVAGAPLYPNGDRQPFGQSEASADYQDAVIAPGTVVTISIFAKIGDSGGIGLPGDSGWTGDPIALVFTVDDFGPHGVVAEIVEGALTLSWTAAAQVPTHWTVTGTIPDEPATQPLTATVDATTLAWSTTTFAADKIYTLVVSPFGATYPDVPASVSVATTTQPAPTGLTGAYDVETQELTVGWSSAATTQGFKAEVRVGGVVTSLVAAADARSLVMPNAPRAGACRFRVGAVGAAVGAVQPVDWSAWLDFAPAIPVPPTIATLVYRPPQVVADWNGEPGVIAYDAQLSTDVAQAGGWVSGHVTPTATGFDATFDAVFTSAKVVAARARACSSQAAGPWSDLGSTTSIQQLLLMDVPAPTSFTAINHDDGVSLSWTAPEAAAPEGYEVLVLAADGSPLSPQPTQTPGGAASPTTLDLDAVGLEDGGLYHLELRARTGRNFSPAVTLDLTRTTEHPGEYLSLHNTLSEPPAGGDVLSQTLTATILNPPDVADVTVAEGQTAALGTTRVSRVQVVSTTTRADKPAFLSRAVVTVTALGGRSSLDWFALESGAAPVGMTIVVAKGYRLALGDVWTTLPVSAMGRALEQQGLSPVPAANLILDAYAGLTLAQLAGAYFTLDSTVTSVATVLDGTAERLSTTPAMRLSATITAFAGSPVLTTPLKLVQDFIAVEGVAAPNETAALVYTGFDGLDRSQAALMAAFVLADRSVPQADALAALTATVGAADPAQSAINAAYGDPVAKLSAYLGLCAALGYDHALAFDAALPFAVGVDPKALAGIVRGAFSQIDAFSLLSLLIRKASVQPDTAVFTVGATGPGGAPALALALKALFPSSSALEGLKQEEASGQGAGSAAGVILQAYGPTTLQLAQLLFDTGTTDPRLLAFALREAGAPFPEIAQAVVNLFPWLKAADISALLSPQG